MKKSVKKIRFSNKQSRRGGKSVHYTNSFVITGKIIVFLPKIKKKGRKCAKTLAFLLLEIPQDKKTCPPKGGQAISYRLKKVLLP